MLKPRECSNCILEKRSNGFSVPSGTGRNGVVILGEGLGQEEYIHGRPFYEKAAAGSKLEEIFRLEGVKRDDFLLWNMIGCQPPGNRLSGASYEKAAIEHCKVHFDPIVRGIRSNTNLPRVLLGLGNVPLTNLTKFSGDPEVKESISFLRGFIYRSKYGLFIPSFHPSYLKRGKPELTPILQFDLRRALEVASEQFTTYEGGAGFRKPEYLEHPSIDEAKSFYYKVRDNPGLLLTYDIETETSANVEEDERDEIEDTEITQIQFSLNKGSGVIFDLTSSLASLFWKVALAILKLDNPKCNHNTWNFDLPRLKAKGVMIGGNISHDSMWMFKHYHPRLPRGLQTVASLAGFPYPWKHTAGNNLPFYGGCDVDAVHYIMEWLPPLMKEMGVWEGYERHVRGVYRVLSRSSDIGTPVSEVQRVELKKALIGERKELNAELQKLIPDEIKNISPKRTQENGAEEYGYKKEPKEVKIGEYEYQQAVKKVRETGKKITSLESFIKRKYNLVKRRITGIDGDTGEVIELERWCKILPFKASKDQVIRYLKWKQAELLKEPNKKVEGGDEEDEIKIGGR